MAVAAAAAAAAAAAVVVVVVIVVICFIYDAVTKWKHFRVTGHLCGEFIGPR